MLITFEGVGGADTTALSRRLHAELLKLQIDALKLNSGYSSPIGYSILSILENRKFDTLSVRAESFLFGALWSQLIEEVVAPNWNRVIVGDRYIDSTLAYQGYGRVQNIKTIRFLLVYAAGIYTPDLTFLLDIDPVAGLALRKNGDETNPELVEFHTRAREGYLQLAQLEPWRWVVLDGTLNEDELADIVFEKALTKINANASAATSEPKF